MVRPEKPEDEEGIRKANELAFGRRAEGRLVDKLRAHGKAAVSLVMTDGEKIIGHILFSPVSIEPERKALSGAGLAPLAVLPEFQNRGIGSRLARAGLDECRRLGFDYVVVLGHPGYYPRFGFARAASYNIRCRYDAPEDAFMIIELKEGALDGCEGTVVYQPEFDEV